MANRYWVGGSGTWNSTSTTNWSASSGGASGASVPTSADSVFFDQASTYTVTLSQTINCLDFTVSAGTVTLQPSSFPTLNVYGSWNTIAGTVANSGISCYFKATTSKTITTNGVILTSWNLLFDGIGGYWTLGSALSNASSGYLYLINGTLDTSINNYSLTFGHLESSYSSTRALILNGSTVLCTGDSSTTWNVVDQTNFTFNAGTSQITNTGTRFGLQITGLTFYNMSFTAANYAQNNYIEGNNTFNNLTLTNRTSAGINSLSVRGSNVINGTLTINAATSPIGRMKISGLSTGTSSLSINTFAAGATDVDFQGIAVTGSAAPISGTRFGNIGGNSGITFPAAKTVYWSNSASANWADASPGNWSATSGGSADQTQFPLAQDTAVFPSIYPSSGSTVTVNQPYAIGTIDMSLRTANTLTLALGFNNPTISGNWINGSGVTITGTGFTGPTFAGRTTQTITSAGITFQCNISIQSPGGTVTLQDALSITSSRDCLAVYSGTFNSNNYNVTLSHSSFYNNVSISSTAAKTIAIGSSTWTLDATSPWTASSNSNLTITGTGIIQFTNAATKTFAGGGFNYGQVNIRQAGTGQLRISGNNTFYNISNTANGSIAFTGGTTNKFSLFNLNGSAGNLLQLTSTNTTPAILQKPTQWFVGANSTNSGNNSGLTFTAGDGIDYLNISYITGQLTPIQSTGNFLLFFK